MPEESIRFGVTNEHAQRSSTWKLWSRVGGGKSDVYLTCRALRGAAKASLHESGNWHVAFGKEYLDREVDADNHLASDRFIDRWPRPRDIGPGTTLAFRVIVPASAVSIPAPPPESDAITWIPSPPDGEAVEISVLILAPETKCTGCPGARSMATQPVGSFALDDGSTLWCVYRYCDIPKMDPTTFRATRFKSGRDVPMTGHGLRIIVFGHDEAGSRFMIEGRIQSPDEAT